MRHPKSGLVAVSLLAVATLTACDDRRGAPGASSSSKPATAPPNTTERGTAPSPSSAPAALSAAPAASADADPVARSTSTLPEYPALPETLTPPCDDPRAVLAVRQQYDRSGRVRLQQALVAHPEFRVRPEAPTAPMDVSFYETIYGVKRFEPAPPGQPMFKEAVIARCFDVPTCERLAAMYRAVSPTDQPRLFCGVPPATTGGEANVRELAPERLVPPPSPDAAASCARFTACAARLGKPDVGRTACASRAAPIRACAAREDCRAVLDCLHTASP